MWSDVWACNEVGVCSAGAIVRLIVVSLLSCAVRSCEDVVIVYCRPVKGEDSAAGDRSEGSFGSGSVVSVGCVDTCVRPDVGLGADVACACVLVW